MVWYFLRTWLLFKVVIVPIYKGDTELAAFNEKLGGLTERLKAMGIRVKYDNADNKRPGFKFADYELKGVPVRLVMGGRDLANNTIELMRRDTLEKETLSFDGIEDYVKNLLEEIQTNIYNKAKNVWTTTFSPATTMKSSRNE